MDEEIFSELKEFIIKQSCVDDERITRETRIEGDLGVTSDDACEFVIAYGKKFNVDVSHFMAADYFDGEGDIILPAIIRGLTGEKKPLKKILTIAHLEKGILTGRLDEDVINS